jgi:dGTP triphosphohydrolase
VATDETRLLVTEICGDIEDWLAGLLEEKFDGIRRELATLTKEAKMLALETQIQSLSEKFVALEKSAAEKEKNKKTTEKSLENQFNSFLETIKDVADKHFAPPKAAKAKMRKRPLTNPRHRVTKRSKI